MTSNVDETFAGERMLIGIIADEDTTMGFLLAGIGEVFDRVPNYEIVSSGNKTYFIFECVNFFNQYLPYQETPKEVLERAFHRLCRNTSMGVILIGSEVKNKIEHAVIERGRRLPIILELPSKNELALTSMD